LKIPGSVTLRAAPMAVRSLQGFFYGGLIMSIFDSEEELKDFCEFVITNKKETIKSYEESVKHYEEAVKRGKERLKASPGDKLIKDRLKSDKHMVITQKEMVKNQRAFLIEELEHYNQRYGKTDVKRLSAKEKKNMAFGKFTVIQGGLCENA